MTICKLVLRLHLKDYTPQPVIQSPHYCHVHVGGGGGGGGGGIKLVVGPDSIMQVALRLHLKDCAPLAPFTQPPHKELLHVHMCM